jgi:antitoxin component of RelBE/YafQ-DinJ toxin-antitoxin module
MAKRPTKSRLNLKIDADLKEWARVYAESLGIDITKLICGYLLQLRQVVESAEYDEVKQI